jgi:hypothetical protein
MIRYTCPHCEAPNTAKDRQAAKLTPCFNCGLYPVKRKQDPRAVEADLPPIVSGPTPIERHGVGLAVGVIAGFVVAGTVILGAILGVIHFAKKEPAGVPSLAETRSTAANKPAAPDYPALKIEPKPPPDLAKEEARRKQDALNQELIDGLRKTGILAEDLFAGMKKNPDGLKVIEGVRIKIIGKAAFHRDKDTLASTLAFVDDALTKVYGLCNLSDEEKPIYRVAFARKDVRTVKIECLVIGFDESKGGFRFERPRLLDAE